MTNEELKMCARCQIRWERDKAMEQLEEHHIPFMCVAEDVVEVVRCKDCTYWDEAKVNSKGFLICPASGMEIFEIDYCSYGERREE